MGEAEAIPSHHEEDQRTDGVPRRKKEVERAGPRRKKRRRRKFAPNGQPDRSCSPPLSESSGGSSSGSSLVFSCQWLEHYLPQGLLSPYFDSPRSGEKSYEVAGAEIGADDCLDGQPVDGMVVSPQQKGREGWAGFIKWNSIPLQPHLKDETEEEREERRRWREWAIAAAESERQRRIAEMEREELAERQLRQAWALNAIEEERQRRTNQELLTSVTNSAWFSDTVSSFCAEYEIVCPYSYLGCRHICLRNHLDLHLAECQFNKEPPLEVHNDVDYVVMCPNAVLGCDHSCPRQDLQVHLDSTCNYRGQGQKEAMAERARSLRMVVRQAEEERARRVDIEKKGEWQRDAEALQARQFLHTLLGAQVRQAAAVLHKEMKTFVNTCKEREAQRRPILDDILSTIRGAVRELWPAARVLPYGSITSGLMTPDSDVDLVVYLPSGTPPPPAPPLPPAKAFKGPIANCSNVMSSVGVSCNISAPHVRSASTGSADVSRVNHSKGGGSLGSAVPAISPVSRISQLAAHLQKVLPHLRVQRVLDHTRIPIIKAVARKGGHTFMFDISIDGPFHTGISTTAFVAALVEQLPPLGPLILVLKNLLQVRGLNNPYTGGLSSYALTLMALFVVLQQNGPVAPPQQTPPPQPNQDSSVMDEPAIVNVPANSSTCSFSTVDQKPGRRSHRPSLLSGAGGKEKDRDRDVVGSSQHQHVEASQAANGCNDANQDSERPLTQQQQLMVVDRSSHKVSQSQEWDRAAQQHLLGTHTAKAIILQGLLAHAPPPPLMVPRTSVSGGNSTSTRVSTTAPKEPPSCDSPMPSISSPVDSSSSTSTSQVDMSPPTSPPPCPAKTKGTPPTPPQKPTQLPRNKHSSIPMARESSTSTCSKSTRTGNTSTSSSKEPDASEPLLGKLLLDFLHLFGQDFEAGAEGVSVRGGGFRFRVLSSQPAHPQASDPIVIEDPLDGLNNVGRTCYGVSNVQRCFFEALTTLKKVMVRVDEAAADRPIISNGILSHIFELGPGEEQEGSKAAGTSTAESR